RRHRLGEAPLVLFIGRRDRRKGYHRFLDAARRVSVRRPDARFAVGGPAVGDAPELPPGVPILDLGVPDVEQKTSAMAAATVVCDPSAGESLGMIYLEA